MRLSDERLGEMLAWPKSPGANGPTFSELAALIAEVRALRECERGLRDLERVGTRVLDVNHHANQSDWTAVQELAQSLIGARAALAGVRALEDQDA